MLILIFIYLVSTTSATVSSSENSTETHCGENGDCISENFDCNTLILFNDDFSTVCGDDIKRVVLAIKSTAAGRNDGSDINVTLPAACATNIKELLKTLTTKYNSHDKIHLEVQRVFQGVIIAVILFGACASFCVLAACIYCCRINYIDHRLKKDVEALAAKLKRDCKLRKPRMKTPPQPVSESCNIVVESAGVYVV